MAAVYDYTVPFLLTTPTPGGSTRTLDINSIVTLDSGLTGYFVLDNLSCTSGASMRVARDDLPQASGEIKHQHYKAGYEMHLRVEMWETIGEAGKPAWRELLDQMCDLLQLHLNSIVGEDPLLDADGRIQWTPDGVGVVDRMLNPIRLLEPPIFSNDGALTTVTFAVLSDRPYAWDAPETTTTITGSATSTLTNDGTAPFYPVVKVHGPFTTFTLRNNTVLDLNGQPLALIYDSSLPGAHSVGPGHYIEIDFWRNTVYLDGNVSNYKAGIDIAASDFWPISPGANAIQMTGGFTGTSTDILWQNAWA